MFPDFLFNFLTIALFVIFMLIICFMASIKVVPQSEEWMLERFGKFSRVMKPGLHFIVPFVEQVSFRISMREQVLDVPHQDVISKDNAMVTVDGVAFYRVFDSQKAAYEVANRRPAMAQLIVTNIRTVLGEMDLDSMLSNRETINNKLLAVVDEATDPWGIKVHRVEIKDIHPPKDLQQAMSRQMKAEREKRALILEAEGNKEASVLKANGKKMSAILEAEGKQQAAILQAKAEKERAFLEAEARERTGKAQENVIKFLSNAIGGEQGAGAEYLLKQQYIDSLQKLGSADNSKTILYPFEANNVVGSLGSLTALVKDVLKDDKPTK